MSTGATQQSESTVGRPWWIALVAILALALATRIHNAFALPPLKDYDAAGHAANAFALFRGALPDPASWSGFHPPLYYAIGAVVWHALPDAFPVHVALRLLSLTAGVGAVFLAWRVLHRFFPPLDAAIVATSCFCAPVFLIATSMLGNETLCALFVTATLAQLTQPIPERGAAKQALRTGLFGALAALSKATGVLALVTAAITCSIRLRSTPRRAVGVLLALGLAPALLLGPLYLHLLQRSGGSIDAVISGSAASVDARRAMERQPPGSRRISDYVSFPSATLVSPLYSAPGLERSVPGLFYATLWADGQGQYLPVSVQSVRAGAALAWSGLLPTFVGLLGVGRGLRRHRMYGWALGPGLFAAMAGLAFLQYSWAFPYFSAVKASYLLSALLPAAVALSLGLTASRGGLRTALRAGLLAVALLDVVLLWQGLWT